MKGGRHSYSLKPAISRAYRRTPSSIYWD
jgi:hypothetical protein